ncbi:MAG: hypothetical protein AAGD22_05540 [Verrucomicrobiota bacterium]
MNTQGSWIDEGELAQLMDQLGDAVAAPSGDGSSGEDLGEEAAAAEGPPFVDVGSGAARVEGSRVAEETGGLEGGGVSARGVEQVGQQLAEIKAQAASSGLIGGEGMPEIEVERMRVEVTKDEVEGSDPVGRSAPSLSALGTPERGVGEEKEGEGALAESETSLEGRDVVEAEKDEVKGPVAGEGDDETSVGEDEGPIPSLRERLQGFSEWALTRAGAKRVLIGDAQGYCLYEGAATEPQVLAAAVMLAKSWQRCLRHLKLKEPGPITVGLGHGYRMMVIPCDTRYGLLTLSLISKGSYDDSITDELRGRLEQVIEARG